MRGYLNSTPTLTKGEAILITRERLQLVVMASQRLPWLAWEEFEGSSPRLLEAAYPNWKFVVGDLYFYNHFPIAWCAYSFLH